CMQTALPSHRVSSITTRMGLRPGPADAAQDPAFEAEGGRLVLDLALVAVPMDLLTLVDHRAVLLAPLGRSELPLDLLRRRLSYLHALHEVARYACRRRRLRDLALARAEPEPAR